MYCTVLEMLEEDEVLHVSAVDSPQHIHPVVYRSGYGKRAAHVDRLNREHPIIKMS